MNHSSTVASIAPQLAVRNALSALSPSLPFILGETNSLYNEGAPGLSNAFGAALWGVDFNLWCAANGISRVHMHQGTNYRYAAWQPIDTNDTSIGTKAPYYGSIAVAAILGDLTAADVRVANIPVDGDEQTVYATYTSDQLRRVTVVNLAEYNYTVDGSGDLEDVNPVPRPSQLVSFHLPDGWDGDREWNVGVKRLSANGSDAITGITWDGWSYNWELEKGKPVRMGNVTAGEKVEVVDGKVSVQVWDSSVVVLEIEGC
jgi:hypothetical protein